MTTDREERAPTILAINLQSVAGAQEVIGIEINGDCAGEHEGFVPILEMSANGDPAVESMFVAGPDGAASWICSPDGVEYELLFEMDAETRLKVQGMFRLSIRPRRHMAEHLGGGDAR